MGKPKVISSGDRSAGLRIEYVKRRGVLRASGWYDEDKELDPLETPVAELFEALGIDGDDMALPRHYLLVAGMLDHPSGRGPVRMRLASFATETEARDAFRQLRQRQDSLAEWAEVVAVDWKDRSRVLCWFGQPWELDSGSSCWWRDAAPSPRPVVRDDAGAGRRRATLRRRTVRRQAEAAVGGEASAGARGDVVNPAMLKLLP